MFKGDTLYFPLYSLTAAEWASSILWATMYGSVEELPVEQDLIPKGGEQWFGGVSPLS